MRFTEEFYDRLRCEHPKKMTPDQLYEHIMAAVEPNLPYLAYPGEAPVEILPLLDYGMRSAWCDWEKLPDIGELDTAMVRPVVHPGGPEGVYLNVELVIYCYGRSDKYIPLFTFKTLDEGPAAYAAMGALGGIISYAMEMFLNIHDFS